jgi:prephenate dehydratase
MKLTTDESIVAFQGARGAFSEEAVNRLLGEHRALLPCRSFDDVFAALANYRADFALVPIENALAGAVVPVHDLLITNQVYIVAEVVIPIEMHLIGCHGAKLEEIRAVESHPVALAQCETFLIEHPHIERRVAEDTAGSVELVVKRNDPKIAAIAGRLAAEVHGGVIVRKNIEDHRRNFTRFALLTSAPMTIGPSDKLSLIYTPSSQMGSLARALDLLANCGIGLLRLETRPVKGRPWSYRHFIDMAPVNETDHVTGLINELRELGESVRLLGHYPSATN